MKYLATLLPVLFLSACDPFGLPETPPETAAYYVATAARNGVIPVAVAITYETPDGTMHDTLRSPSLETLTSWSKVFDRDALPSFSITAKNITLPDSVAATGNGGLVSVSLLIDQKTVAFDTSATSVTLSF